jgi:hypothetical protein
MSLEISSKILPCLSVLVLSNKQARSKRLDQSKENQTSGIGCLQEQDRREKNQNGKWSIYLRNTFK